MIVVDTSALMAILLGEPEADAGDLAEGDVPVISLGDTPSFPSFDRPAATTDAPTSRDAPGVDAPPVDTGAACPARTEACGGGCVDTLVSPAHCGGARPRSASRTAYWSNKSFK